MKLTLSSFLVFDRRWTFGMEIQRRGKCQKKYHQASIDIHCYCSVVTRQTEHKANLFMFSNDKSEISFEWNQFRPSKQRSMIQFLLRRQKFFPERRVTTWSQSLLSLCRYGLKYSFIFYLQHTCNCLETKW